MPKPTKKSRKNTQKKQQDFPGTIFLYGVDAFYERCRGGGSWLINPIHPLNKQSSNGFIKIKSDTELRRIAKKLDELVVNTIKELHLNESHGETLIYGYDKEIPKITLLLQSATENIFTEAQTIDGLQLTQKDCYHLADSYSRNLFKGNDRLLRLTLSDTEHSRMRDTFDGHNIPLH